MTSPAAEPGLSPTDLHAQKHVFHPLRVARIVVETHDARSIVFDIPPALRQVFQYRAGQFLTLEVPHGGVKLKRCYSLASSPDTEGEHKVTVKRVAGGRISNWVNDALRVGDVVSVLPPDGRFVMSELGVPMVLWSGGSGITPCIALIKTALARTSRTLQLVYANRDERSIIFRDELDQLVLASRGRLSIVHRLDDVHGFLRAEHIGPLLGGRADGEHYLCGPGPFMDAVERGLVDLRVPEERLHVERFVSPADPKPEGQAASVPVTPAGNVPEVIEVELKGEKRAVPYTAGKSLLRAALDAGLDAPYSCEDGICGCCMAHLVEGEVVMTADDALSPEEKKKGIILTCQARPLTRRCAIKYVEY